MIIVNIVFSMIIYYGVRGGIFIVSNKFVSNVELFFNVVVIDCLCSLSMRVSVNRVLIDVNRI